MPDHFGKLERMYVGSVCNRPFEPEIEVSEDACALRLRAGSDWHHAGGKVHGSIYFKALDDAAYFAAQSRVRDRLLLTTSFQVHLLRPFTEGTLHARGRVLHRSRTSILAEAEVADEGGRTLARGTGTFVPGGALLTDEIGYR